MQEILDLSQPKPSPDLIRKFVSRIVPDGKSNFRWYLNLDGGDSTIQDMVVEGRKNHAVVTICQGEPNAPPNPDAVIDLQNTSILAIPHRQLSKVDGSFLNFETTIGFDKAYQFQKEHGHVLRKSRWKDITARVMIDIG